MITDQELAEAAADQLARGESFGNYIFNSLDKCEVVKYI